MGNRTVTKFVIGNKSLEQSEDASFCWIVKSIDGTELKSEVIAKCITMTPTPAMFRSKEINPKNIILQVNFNSFRDCRKLWIESDDLILMDWVYFQFRVDLSKKPSFQQWDIHSQSFNPYFSQRVYVLDLDMVTIDVF